MSKENTTYAVVELKVTGTLDTVVAASAGCPNDRTAIDVWLSRFRHTVLACAGVLWRERSGLRVRFDTVVRTAVPVVSGQDAVGRLRAADAARAAVPTGALVRVEKATSRVIRVLEPWPNEAVCSAYRRSRNYRPA